MRSVKKLTPAMVEMVRRLQADRTCMIIHRVHSKYYRCYWDDPEGSLANIHTVRALVGRGLLDGEATVATLTESGRDYKCEDQPQAPGYHHLKKGDEIRDGDEFFDGSRWRVTSSAGFHVHRCGQSFRRPISNMAPLPPEMADLVTPMAPALVWGKERPTVEGWFWTRGNNGCIQIARTWFNTERKLVLAWVHSERRGCLISEIPNGLYECAGPISKPLEVGGVKPYIEDDDMPTDEELWREDDEHPRCDCHLCVCLSRSDDPNGGRCADCMVGAHQG